MSIESSSSLNSPIYALIKNHHVEDEKNAQAAYKKIQELGSTLLTGLDKLEVGQSLSFTLQEFSPDYKILNPRDPERGVRWLREEVKARCHCQISDEIGKSFQMNLFGTAQPTRIAKLTITKTGANTPPAETKEVKS